MDPFFVVVGIDVVLFLDFFATGDVNVVVERFCVFFPLSTLPDALFTSCEGPKKAAIDPTLVGVDTFGGIIVESVCVANDESA